QACGLAFVFQIGRAFTDGGELQDRVVRADHRRAFDHHVRSDLRTLTDFDIGSNHRKRSDLDICGQPRARVDNSLWMYRHVYSALRSAHRILASAASSLSTYEWQ